jgi:hypothetical protein
MRFLEGLSTGAMLFSYLQKTRLLSDVLLWTYMAHWMASFLYHHTSTRHDLYYDYDVMLIHILISERMIKCIPFAGIMFQLLFIIRNEYYGNIYNCLVAFAGTYSCGCWCHQQSFFSLYTLTIIMSGVFYGLNNIFAKIGYTKLMSLSIIIYHLFLGWNVYLELPFENSVLASYNGLIVLLRGLSWLKFFLYKRSIQCKFRHEKPVYKPITGIPMSLAR